MKANGSKISGAKTNGAKTRRSNSKHGGNPATDLGKLRQRSAASIRKGIAADPDAHATDAEFWKSATVVMPTPKEIVTMRLDADLLRWFRQQRGYQTRINAILRAYMQAHESA
jgi:uncharacterized protein (DUF4415 family)